MAITFAMRGEYIQLDQLLTGVDADRLQAMDEVLWKNPGTQIYETSITTPDVMRHDTIYYKATYTGADGSVAGLIGTIIDITDRKHAEQREVVENAVARFRTTHDRSSLTQINRGVVGSLDLRFAEVLNPTAARDAGTPRSCFQRTYINVVLPKTEFRFRHPGNWTVVFEVSVYFPQPEIPLVTTVQQRVSHIGGEVVSDKIQRNSLVIPQELSATHLEAIDG
jgi:hypothetical protein